MSVIEALRMRLQLACHLLFRTADCGRTFSLVDLTLTFLSMVPPGYVMQRAVMRCDYAMMMTGDACRVLQQQQEEKEEAREA